METDKNMWEKIATGPAIVPPLIFMIILLSAEFILIRLHYLDWLGKYIK